MADVTAAVALQTETPRLPLLGEAETPSQTLRRTLMKLVRAHGFAGGAYIHLGHRFADLGETATKTPPCRLVSTGNLNEELYRRRNYMALDPLAARAAVSFTPFTWTLKDLVLTHPASAPYLRALEAWGVRSGVVAPVQDHAGGPALVNLFRPQHTHSEGDAQVTDGALQLDAARLHAAARLTLIAETRPSDDGRLTEREMEVLRLAALGWGEHETAAALSLSRRGVQYHLWRAIEKLGVANKTAAVARAVSLGLVQV